MFIKKIELTNIKAYTHKIIEFSDGVNFISGKNGAGKTTIIESIGYALFGFQYSEKGFYKSMIRKGEKKGTIDVTFITNDHEEYIAHRELKTASSSWAIFKMVNGEKEEVVSKEKETVAWLKEHLGFEADDQIDDIYSKIISVPQGLMTASFMLSDAARKKEFDPIFKLEQYRQIADKIKLENEFEANIQETREQINRLEGKIEREEELIERQKELSKNLEDKKKEIEDFKEADKETVDSFNKMDAERREIEEIKNNLKVKETEKIRFENEKNRLAKELEETKTAVETLKSNEAGYKKYLSTSEEIEEKEAESKKLEAVLSEVEEKKQNVTRLKSQIEERTRHLKAIEDDIEKIKNKIKEETVLLNGYTEKKNTPKEESNIDDELDKYQRAINKLAEHEANLNLVNEKISEALNNLNTSDKELLYLTEATSKVEILRDNTEGELQKIASDALEAISKAVEVSKTNNKSSVNSDELLKQKDEIMNGIKRIADYFKISSTDISVLKEEVEKLQAELQKTQKNLAVEEAKLDKDIENKKKLIENYNKDIASKEDSLKSETEEKDKWQKDIEENQKEIDAHKDELLEKEKIDSEIEQKRNLLKTLQAVYENYTKNVGAAEKLADLEKQNEENSKAFDANSKELSELNERLSKLNESFDEDVYKNTKVLYDALKSAADYREKELNDINIKLDEVNKDLNDISENKKEIVKLNEDAQMYTRAKELVKSIRDVIKMTPEYIAELYVNRISKKAASIYQKIASDTNRLVWDKDYSLSLVDVFNGHEEKKNFNQLSGGEQMTAALSVRLAMLELLTNLKIGILDEPTTNIDTIRRSQLAEQIEMISSDYNQIFVVSHDDTFDSCTAHIISIGG